MIIGPKRSAKRNLYSYSIIRLSIIQKGDNTLSWTKSMLVLCALLIAGVNLSNAMAQKSADKIVPNVQIPLQETELLRALLEEVRLLRLFNQRTSLATYRAMVLIEQKTQQQNHVDAMTEEVERVKAQIQQSQDISFNEQELRNLEDNISNAISPQSRQQFVQVYNDLKRSQERQREYARQDMERSRNRQQQLESMLQVEQARLAEIQQKLSTLDSELTRLASEGRKNH